MSEEEDIGQLDITDEMIAEGRSYNGVMPDDMPKLMAKIILLKTLLQIMSADLGWKLDHRGS